MSPHKGGEGAVPFGGFDYTDDSGQVQNGSVTVTYGNNQTASKPFVVDQVTHQAAIAGPDFATPAPTNVSKIEFTTNPVFPAAPSDPDMAPLGEYMTGMAQGRTKPVPPSTEYMNVITCATAPPTGG